MRAAAFEVAGVHLQFQADTDDTDTLKRLFQKFPSPRQLRPDVAVALHQNRCSWKTHTSSGSIRLLNPRAATAAATMLLARLLAEVRPTFVILHGNGLKHPRGHAVLLLGDSGAGKTTLTREILASPFNFQQIAEDVLVLDPDQGLLHPFPRALALRTSEETLSSQPSFGFADETQKGRPLQEFSAHPQPTSLRHAAVFLLARSSMPSTTDQQPVHQERPLAERAWLSWADEHTADALRRAGLPLSRITIGSSVAVLDYHRPLTNDERAHQHRLFDQLHILHLHSATIQNPVEPQAPPAHPPRPESPVCEPMAPGEAIRGCLTHLRRVAGQQAQGEASRVFLQLARALSSSRFHKLIPGGTPHETAQLLARHAVTEDTPA